MRLVSLLLTTLAVFAGVAAVRAATASRPVPRWDRFEQEVTLSRPFADPVREITLEVTYTAPDGRTIPFWGFHDGGTTWRFRYMPDQLGTWHYEAKFSDGTPAAKGTFECVSSSIPGLIGVHHPNPVWFGYQGGDAVILRGLHVGDRFFARNWDDAADDRDGNPRAAFLDWAAQQGYNTLSIASHYLNRRSKGRGEGWDTPALWPIDAAEYQRMERILDDLAQRRFIVYPFAGFFGRDSNFPRQPAEQLLYIRYTLARLAPYWNVLLNVAGPEPRLRRTPYLSMEEIHRLGAEIARHDPFGHALSVHNPTGDDMFKDAPWLTFGTLQGPKTFDRRKLASGLLLNRHHAKPLLAQETLWSGNSIHMKANKGSDYSDADLRKNAYVIHFSAANIIFADNDGNSSTGFTGSLDLDDRRQSRHDILKRVWDTFASLPYAKTKPAPQLARSRDTEAFCLADEGRTYLVYLESRGSVDVQVLGGPYQVEWIDAQDPSNRRRGDPTSDGQQLTSPAEGDDWILHLKR